jgi:CheY-like chemotaxis protein
MHDAVSRPQLVGTRVLIIEDNDEHRFLLEAHLTKSGCTVTSTSSAEDAMVLYPELAPDLVFVDVQMPGMSGFGFVEWLRALDSVAPRIVTTSVLDPADHPLGDAILTKPFSRACVARVLDDYLALRNS